MQASLMGRRKRTSTGLIAACLFAACLAILGYSRHSPASLVSVGGRLAVMQARWMGEARAARASGAVRTAKTRAALQRKLRPAGRKLAKLALVSQQAPGSAKLAAAEAGQEFGAWMKTWHQKHPGASLVEEQVSWDARENELSRIAAWEAHQERRMTMKTEELQRPMSGNQPVAPGATIESSTVAAGEGADETTETPEEKAAQEQEHAEAEVEAGVSENVAEEDREESTPASSSSYGSSGWGPTEAPEESPLSPEERIAQARKEIAESHTAPHNPARAEYMEHKAYWARAKAHMADEPCVPATFWYEGSIDPRPKCKKAAPVLNYEPQKALPPAPVAGPFEGEDEQERMAEPTVLGVPDGPPDFNGDSAVIAHHPFMGWQPTDLEERGGETRGSFSVVSAPSGFDNEGDVQLAIYGPPKTPIGCKIRGYRKLSGDFQGNVISTGFSQSWQSLGQIQTGPISPGVTNEYDIITCRDQKNGETQHFRLSWGSSGYNDLQAHGPVHVLGPHTGMNTDSVTFDMDRPTHEDQHAIDDYYDLNYNPATDDKPFSSGLTQ